MERTLLGYGHTTVNKIPVKHEFYSVSPELFELVIYSESDVTKDQERTNVITVPSNEVQFAVAREPEMTDENWTQTINNYKSLRGDVYVKAILVKDQEKSYLEKIGLSKTKAKEAIVVYKEETRTDKITEKVTAKGFKQMKSFKIYCNLTPRQQDEFARNYLTQKNQK